MARARWRSFPDARAFVRGLGLLDAQEWMAFSRGDLDLVLGAKPPDIPTTPGTVYRRAGWSGWRDWIGPPPIEPVETGFLNFKRARVLARSLEFRSAAQWRSWCAGRLRDLPRRPANVPEDPARMYPRAWRGWADWLGMPQAAPRTKKADYLPFEQARAWARSQSLRNAKEWTALCAGRLRGRGVLPPGIPASPSLVYRHCGWNGFGDWLGTGRVHGADAPFLPFEEAREFVRTLGLSTSGQYFSWSTGRQVHMAPRPSTIPGDPDRIYVAQGWTSWGDFLGTGNVHWSKRRFRPFAEARAFARGLGFKRGADWYAFAAGARPDLGDFPSDLPTHPRTIYADEGWTGWGDFLGTGNVAPADRVFRSFEEARAFARSLRLRSGDQWAAFTRGEPPGAAPLPPDMPRAPQSAFRGRGWSGWGDFLGTGNVASNADRAWRPFVEARQYARTLGLKTRAEWSAFVRREALAHPDLPRDLVRAYTGHGWKGWCDFLGVERRRREPRRWRPFEEARAFARSLRFSSSHAWEAWSRGDRPDLAPRPADIPAAAYLTYANDGWRGWRDFLGTG